MRGKLLQALMWFQTNALGNPEPEQGYGIIPKADKDVRPTSDPPQNFIAAMGKADVEYKKPTSICIYAPAQIWTEDSQCSMTETVTLLTSGTFCVSLIFLTFTSTPTLAPSLTVPFLQFLRFRFRALITLAHTTANRACI